VVRAATLAVGVAIAPRDVTKRRTHTV
jgi:hypothetical protein